MVFDDVPQNINYESIDKNDISLSEDQLRVINSRFSNIFKAY